MIELITANPLSRIPFISNEVLDEYATAVVKDFSGELLTEPAPFDVFGFIENHLGLDVVYHKLCYSSKVMGFTAFKEGVVRVFDERTGNVKMVSVEKGTVIIDESLKANRNLRRLRFTAMHEGSHWLLHRQVFERNNRIGSIKNLGCQNLAAKIGTVDYSRSKLDKTDKDRMERQADFLAAGILMSLPALRIAYRKYFASICEKPRTLVYGTDPQEEKTIKNITAYIADTFNVSNRAALIRLEKLNAVVTEGAVGCAVI